MLEVYLKEGNGNPPQYSCLKNPMDRGAWQATVHGVTKSWIWLSMHRFICKEINRGKKNIFLSKEKSFLKLIIIKGAIVDFVFEGRYLCLI